VMDRNQTAQQFWRRAIGEFLAKPVDPTHFVRNNDDWGVFSFESRQAE
jgi:hypothetical protein